MLPYIDIPFIYLADVLGTSKDDLKVIVSFVLSYPFAGLLKRIPDSKPYQKNLFIIAVSVFYLIGLFDLWAGTRTLLISAGGTYLIAAKIQGPFMPWIGFVFVMAHMSINHIYRLYEEPGSWDISGAQMVMVMKLTAFCWNVHDGRLPQKDLSEFQRERALPTLPSLLDYAGYIFFFPSLFAGPAFDYVEYRRWIETSMFEVPAGTDPTKRPPTRKKRKIPRSGTPAAWKAAAGFFWIFAFLKFSGWYSNELLLGSQYMKYGFLRRVWVLYMLGFAARLKYYGVWSLTEGACILSGIGYKGIDPKTGRVHWNRLQNVNPWGLETAQNTRAYLENWNMNTNHWLRNYMYLRVTPKGKKPGFRASMATFVTSAFWHGVYPGYYLAFVLASFLQTVAKNFRRHVRPFFLTADGTSPTPYKKYYDIASLVTTQLAFSFTAAPFVLLSLHDSLLVWSRVYFYCIVGVVASVTFFASPGKAWLVEELQRRHKVALVRNSSQENLTGPMMGLPNDPGEEVSEIVREVKSEMETRRRRSLKG
ncbi:putative MBOAT family protein [Xylona heveae TC161]|uniref:Putative MBOAT family protein n=1 Tax=Xylona heveae (strain CBS 132557 / TC161) TaxID=1328760 RepID=A0A165FRD5_XYLHT|nr:putative MBOAT family protein [Xylona heveae TC161]KZF21287.1 putative MBOAT family protein [Xylona heveae TC161]